MPSIVQSKTAAGTSLTFSSATTAGNCLVVFVLDFTVLGAPAVSAVTLGGSADHFAAAKTAPTTQSCLATAWVDPNCAGGQTVIAVTESGGTNPVIIAYELSGIAASSPVDQTNAQTAASTIWSSGSVTTSASPTEAILGAAVIDNRAPTGPGPPWTNLTLTSGATDAIAGEQITTSTGTFTYNGTSLSAANAAVIITLLPAAAATPAPLVPFRGARAPSAAVPGRPVSRARGRAALAPAPFTPPRGARGPAAAMPGRPVSRGRGTVVLPPTTPAPLMIFRGRAAPSSAVPGRPVLSKRGVITPVFPVISRAPVIPGDILKPWRKHAWPRGPQPQLADIDSLLRQPPETPGPGPGGTGGPGQAAAILSGGLPGQAARAARAAAAVTARAARAARAVNTGSALQDPAVAEGVFYWQQQRTARKREPK